MLWVLCAVCIVCVRVRVCVCVCLLCVCVVFVCKYVHLILHLPVISTGEDFNIIQQEIGILSECKHPNIVGYFGSYLRSAPPTGENWLDREYSLCTVCTCDRGSLPE